MTPWFRLLDFLSAGHYSRRSFDKLTSMECNFHSWNYVERSTFSPATYDFRKKAALLVRINFCFLQTQIK